MMTRDEVVRHLALAEAAARAAGAFIRSHWAQPGAIDRKADATLVTRVDTGSEALLRAFFAEHSPACAFFGEEAGRSGGDGSDGQAWWVVDPVDGTTNLAHGFPWVAVSIALMRDQRRWVGVVYNPILEMCFSAGRGHGARLNGAPLRVSSGAILSDALVATGFPVGPHAGGVLPNGDRFLRIAARCHNVRRAGSAALDLAAVAAGWLDAYWETGLNPWDVAAGSLLVEEAGGQVSDPAGAPFDAFTGEVLATNGHLHATMVDALGG